MSPISPTNDVAELYPLQTQQDKIDAGPAGPALRQITAAWNALDGLESNLPGGPDRWQAESLFVAREGMRRAWLALSNLDRRLRRQNHRDGKPSDQEKRG
jgi:hypothetical protein